MSAQFEHPDFPREIADAPDIDNVPAASSMHALMECVTEIYHGVRQIMESMSPEATAERARVIAPLAMELTRGLDEAAPLDPSKVEVEITDWEDFRPGDVVVQNPDADRVEGATFLVQRDQPASEPEPEWNPGTLAIVTPSMYGGIVNRALRGTDGGWYTEAGGHWDDDEVSDVHELVVIDPAAVDVDALATALREAREEYSREAKNPTLYQYQAIRALAHLGIEVAR